MIPVASEAGQAVQLILMDEVRSVRGGPFLPDLVAQVATRYRFVSFPTNISDFTQTQQPLKFQVGVINANEITIAINSLEIYNDGIVVNARHTDDADVVIEDFTGWATRQFGFREPITKIERRYFSAVVVDFEQSFGFVIDNFRRISETVSKAFNADRPFVFQRLALSGDSTQQVGHKTWQIEPRISQPFVQNRYFSTAHLRTSEHFEMLAALEALART
jgi:hypothetical protein